MILQVKCFRMSATSFAIGRWRLVGHGRRSQTSSHLGWVSTDSEAHVKDDGAVLISSALTLWVASYVIRRRGTRAAEAAELRRGGTEGEAGGRSRVPSYQTERG